MTQRNKNWKSTYTSFPAVVPRPIPPVIPAVILATILIALSVCVITCFIPQAQAQTDQENNPGNELTEMVPRTGTVEPSILLSVLRGNPSQGGGQITEFRLQNGQSTFIQATPTDIVQNQLQQINNRFDTSYQTANSELDRQIALKISAIQKKRQESLDEIYPAFRAPLDLQRQQLEQELSDLELQRNQLESAQRAKNNMQRNSTSSVPPPPTTVAAGYSIRPEVTEDGQIIFTFSSQGLNQNAIQSTIQAAQDKWVQLSKGAQGGESEIWIKGRVVENNPPPPEQP